MPTIAALAAAVFSFFTFTLIVPVAAAILYADWRALEAFLLVAITYGFLSSILTMALAPRLRKLNRAGWFQASLAMWIALVIAAMPLFILLERQSVIDAFFESVSAVVTLGVTFRPLDQISGPMGFYRSILAWQGGLLTLLLAIYVLGRSEVGGTQSQHLRLLLHSSQSGLQRLQKTFWEVFIPYSTVTFLCVIGLMLAQTSPGDALSLAFSVVATSGFVPFQTGASVLNNIGAEVILCLFMIIGATSILWHRALITRRWRLVGEQVEGAWFIIAILVLSAFAMLLNAANTSGSANVLQRAFGGVFDVVSIMTTTGLTYDQRFGISLPIELVFGLALVGGCAYSTSGGIKVFRFGTMLHHSMNELRLLVYPHAILTGSVNNNAKAFTRAKAVWSALFLSVLVIVVSTLLFSLNGLSLIDSLGAAIGAFSSTGNLLEGSLQVPGNALPDTRSLGLAALIALFGRVEFLVILATFGRSKW